jgi:hypothetical protein
VNSLACLQILTGVAEEPAAAEVSAAERLQAVPGGYVIDWVNHPQVGLDVKIVGDAFAPQKSSELEKIKKKLANTLNFVKHVKPSADQARVMSQFPYSL